MISLLIILTLIFALFYAYYNRRVSYWQRRGVVGPKSEFFFGHLRQLGPLSNSQVRKIMNWTKQYGSVYGIQRGIRNALVISDPKLAHEVLVEKFEDFNQRDHAPVVNQHGRFANPFMSSGIAWKRVRSVMSPLFSTQNLRKHFSLVDSAVTETAERVAKEAKQKPGAEFELMPFFEDFAINVTIHLISGKREEPEKRRAIFDENIKVMESLRAGYSFYSWMFPIMGRLLFLMHFIQHAVFNVGYSKFVRAIAEETIGRQAELKANPDVEPTDYSSYFARFISDSPPKDHSLIGPVKTYPVLKALSQFEAVGESMTVFFAGLDTVANTASSTAFRLADDQRVQDKLRAEIMEIVGDGEPTFEQINQLKYADAVIKESLRVHTIGIIVESRRAVRNTRIGDIPIDAKTDILVNVVAIHRDPKIWGEDVNEFRPERFLELENPPHFYGFGDGPRSCVGMRLGMIQQKLLLCRYLRLVRLELPKVNAFDDRSFCMFPEKAKIAITPL